MMLSAAFGNLSNRIDSAGHPDLADRMDAIATRMAAPTFWRAPSGYTHPRGTTALDVVRFEAEEHGNDDMLEAALASGLPLESIPANEISWVTREQADAARYGDPESFDVDDHRIIVPDDGDGGMLIWTPGMSSQGSARRWTRTAAPIMDLYHGTREHDLAPEDIEPSMPPYRGGVGEGVYFGLKPETAEFFGPNVLHRQMDIQNPLVIDAWEGINYRWPPDYEEMYERGEFDSILVGERVRPFDVFIGGEWHPIRDGYDMEDIGPMAAEAGHDAVILRGIRDEHTGYGNEEVLVLPHHPEFQARREASVRTAKRKSHFQVLKDNRVELTPEERKKVMDAKAVWHHGPDGKASPAVWKAVIDGKASFVCNTHRAYQERKSLDAAIRIFHDFIKGTA